LSLTLAEGECLHLSGRSGLGKSTLLRSLAALVDATAGQVSLEGRTPAELGYPEWRRSVCYVAPRVEPLRQPLREWLELPRRFSAVERALRGGKVPWEAGLERLGLGTLDLERSVADLSTGERQRAAVLRALGVEPRVLLLDEAAAGLDPESLARLVELLRDWREGDFPGDPAHPRHPRGILWVSHQAIEADRSLDLALFAPVRQTGAALGAP
jgi:ABC-type iron transport system FetAB ATPase subunit